MNICSREGHAVVIDVQLQGLGIADVRARSGVDCGAGRVGGRDVKGSACTRKVGTGACLGHKVLAGGDGLIFLGVSNNIMQF